MRLDEEEFLFLRHTDLTVWLVIHCGHSVLFNTNLFAKRVRARRRRTSVVPEIRILAPSLEGLDEVPPTRKQQQQTTIVEPETRIKRERYNCPDLFPSFQRKKFPPTKICLHSFLEFDWFPALFCFSPHTVFLHRLVLALNNTPRHVLFLFQRENRIIF